MSNSNTNEDSYSTNLLGVDSWEWEGLVLEWNSLCDSCVESSSARGIRGVVLPENIWLLEGKYLEGGYLEPSRRWRGCGGRGGRALSGGWASRTPPGAAAATPRTRRGGPAR